MPWRRRLLLGALLALLVSAALPSVAAARGCSNVSTDYIQAKNVKAFEGLRCSLARKTLKRYFRKVVASAQTPGGCAQNRFSQGCRVRSFRCYSTYGSGRIRGECSGPAGTVRFREIDSGPG
jgi:hypothetical protein